MIEIPHPVNSNHNGGQLQFLGDLLYFGTGDGGSAGDPPNNAQNRESLLGKLLRIDPRPSGGRPYSVPASNPFVGRPGRDEIYSYGLRNPFRFSFDTVSAGRRGSRSATSARTASRRSTTRRSRAASGANFGWDAFEGFAPYRDENSGTPDPGGTVKPIFAYPHSRGGCSIIGGYVVADRGLASLYKRYVYTDYCDGTLRSLVPHLGRASGDRKLGLSVSEPSSFGVDDRGHLYVTSLAGPVYRVVVRPHSGYSWLTSQGHTKGASQVESGTAETSTRAAGAANGADEATARRPERIDVLNPANGEVVGSIEVDTPERVAATVARVRANQADWEALGIEGRYHWLGKLRDWILDNTEQIADTMQAETGKVRGRHLRSTSVYVADLINFYGTKAAELHRRRDACARTRRCSPRRSSAIQYRPHPVVGVISPWNFPLAMALGDSIPALQAGAAVVVKPSEFTPLSLIEVIKAWKEEIGAPDVFDCVLGTGEVGGALIDHVDYVQFTGSDRTGRKVMARAAETLTPVSLELGGKDPMIVLSDADVDRAANAAAWGGMVNSGQLCISVERIYVEEPVYDEFVAKLTKEVGGLRQGPDGRKPEKRRRRDDLAEPDRDRRGPGQRRPRQRRPGADRRQEGRRARATTSSRPCWSTSTTR